MATAIVNLLEILDMSKKEQQDQPIVDEEIGADQVSQEEYGTETEETIEDLRLMLEDTRSKADEQFNKVLLVQAEMENLRKRTKRELENAHKFALEKFANELLNVRDSMEMGLAAAKESTTDLAKIQEGMDLTLKMLASAMSKFEIEQINPEGERFDPDMHQAMSMKEAPEVESNTVLTVVQKGYTLNGRLIRPALVIVSSGGKKTKKEVKKEKVEQYQVDQDPEKEQKLDEQA